MSGERRFRFGAVAGFARTGQQWAAAARHVEQLGFATLLCPDGTGTLAPFQALSAAAAATSTLRLGSYVLAAPLRAPGARRRHRAELENLAQLQDVRRTPEPGGASRMMLVPAVGEGVQDIRVDEDHGK